MLPCRIVRVTGLINPTYGQLEWKSEFRRREGRLEGGTRPLPPNPRGRGGGRERGGETGGPGSGSTSLFSRAGEKGPFAMLKCPSGSGLRADLVLPDPAQVPPTFQEAFIPPPSRSVSSAGPLPAGTGKACCPNITARFCDFKRSRITTKPVLPLADRCKQELGSCGSSSTF